MDYINPSDDNAMFYDVYISRQINGHTFFPIPLNSSWDSWPLLFWNDPPTKSRYEAGQPFQVFSCWNGITAFTAQPIMNSRVKFRSWFEGECVAGEPTILCKDLWYHGYGKIAVVPSVAVGYDDEKSAAIKKVKGTVSEWVAKERQDDEDLLIEWKGPPEKVNCAPAWHAQHWVPWDDALAANGVAP